MKWYLGILHERIKKKKSYNTRYVGKRFIFATIECCIFLFITHRSVKITTTCSPVAIVKMNTNTIDSEKNKNPVIQDTPRRKVIVTTLIKVCLNLIS